MPKNIILCSDGTGNRDIKGRGTNVFKLFEAIDLNDHRTDPNLTTQLAFYDDGVGTRGNVFLQGLGGAVGFGLKRNVKELYRELSRVYDPGDKIFLFGFSRGAFTVRTLAGLIGVCGVLKGEHCATARQLRAAVEDCYDVYRSRYRSVLTSAADFIFRSPSREAATQKLQTRHQLYENVQIEFIGVWDTVDAVGTPFALADFVNHVIYQFKFSTNTLGPHVKRACHALSVDDERSAFEPVLWTGPDDRIEQVWFAGVHSNVGGGYPKQGLSLVALDWMLTKAEASGLRLQKLDRELFRGHATADDVIYDSRADIGLFYRWAPRDIRRFCDRRKIPPVLHLSVAERIAHATDDYAPGNIPPDAAVTVTLPDANDPHYNTKEQILTMRAEAVQRVLRGALQARYLLDEVSGAVSIGTLSYGLFVAAWLGVVLVCTRSAITMLSGNFVLDDYAWWTLVASSMAFGMAWVLSSVAERAMSDWFSMFWQTHQRDLRSALKHAKNEAKNL